MNRVLAALGRLPTAALVLIAIALVVQVVLQVYGLVDLSRRANVLGGRKWLWVIIIIGGNLLGAIVYLALGRVAADPFAGSDADRAGGEQATHRAIDRLYKDKP